MRAWVRVWVRAVWRLGPRVRSVLSGPRVVGLAVRAWRLLRVHRLLRALRPWRALLPRGLSALLGWMWALASWGSSVASLASSADSTPCLGCISWTSALSTLGAIGSSWRLLRALRVVRALGISWTSRRTRALLVHRQLLGTWRLRGTARSLRTSRRSSGMRALLALVLALLATRRVLGLAARWPRALWPSSALGRA